MTQHLNLTRQQMTNVILDTEHVYMILASTRGMCEIQKVRPAVQFRLQMLNELTDQDFVSQSTGFLKAVGPAFTGAVETLNGG